MSAFRCSDLHTAALALFFARLKGANPDTGAADIACRLRALNDRALACRYRDEPEPLAALPDSLRTDAQAWLAQAGGADIRSLAHCFQYQCSEGDTDTLPDWNTILVPLVTLADKCSASQEFTVWGI